MKMKRFLLVVFSLLLLLAFIGCSDDTNNSSVTNPNPNNFYPKGYVQGKVVDSCTLKPIVGAVIDIGVAKAVTDSNGQYSMANVPATSYVDYTAGGDVGVEVDLDFNRNGQVDVDDIDISLDLQGTTSGWMGSYSATIDMTKATVDGVKVSGSTVYKYASKYYEEVSVKFSSLKESDGNVSTTSNHDTPVAQIGNGNFDFLLGQMTSGINGDAVWASTYDATTGKIALRPVAKYVVALYTATGNEINGNSTTGNFGHRVATTLTDENGHFTFTGLETKQAYIIAVVDSATSAAKYAGYVLAHTLCDNDILTFNIQDGKAIMVFSTDVVCPFVQLATVDGQGPYADLSKETIADGVDVVLTFSEPIKKTNLNTGRALLNTTDYDNGLYQDIEVRFVGFKASNIPHTLAWNDAMNALTIHIDAKYLQPASVYGITILDPNNLKDEAGNLLTTGIGTKLPVSSILPGEVHYDCAPDAYNMPVMMFTTYGVIPASKVTDLKVIPETSLSGVAQLPYELDYNDGAKLDWTGVLGAKSYNLYCRLIQWNNTTCNNDPCDPQCTTTGQYHPFELITNTNNTSYFTNFQGSDGGWYYINGVPYYNADEDNFEYVERKVIKLGYECYLRGVDADGIEGEESNIVLIEDTVNPTITTVAKISVNQNQTSFTVCFSEPMNEFSVENAGWTINAAAFTTVPDWDVDYYNNCAHFDFSPNATTIAAMHTTSANVLALGGVNVTVLGLTLPTGIVDVAGNPLVITAGQLPVNILVPYVSP